MNKPDAWSLNPKVTQYLAQTLPPETVTLELGGGHGSPALHSHFVTCCTVEHLSTWCHYLDRQGLNYHPAQLAGGWYEVTPELRALFAAARLIVVDGPPGRRRQYLVNHLDLIEPGTVVALDDSQRLSMGRLRAKVEARGWQVLESIADGSRRCTIYRTPTNGTQ